MQNSNQLHQITHHQGFGIPSGLVIGGAPKADMDQSVVAVKAAAASAADADGFLRVAGTPQDGVVGAALAELPNLQICKPPPG